LEKLSTKWLAICNDYLEFNGASFNAPWSGDLSHIYLRLTSASGGALATFSVHSKPATSALLASGVSPSAEAELLKMFVDSLRKVVLVKQAATSSDPFQQVLAIKERPIKIVVPWPDRTISEQDHELIRELAIHTAGAFFVRNSRQN